MDHELTAKWHELDKIQIGLKDAVVLQPDLSDVQRQIGDLADLTTDAKENLVAAISEIETGVPVAMTPSEMQKIWDDN